MVFETVSEVTSSKKTVSEVVSNPKKCARGRVYTLKKLEFPQKNIMSHKKVLIHFCKMPNRNI